MFSSVLSFSKLQNTKKRLRKLANNVSLCHYAFEYIFLYLYSKDDLFKINPKAVELLEELVTFFIPHISTESDQNYTSLCHIIFAVYQLFVFDLQRSYKNLSSLTQSKTLPNSTNSNHNKTLIPNSKQVPYSNTTTIPSHSSPTTS